MDRPIPTLNRTGFQLGSTSPLLQNWLESSDETHPLLDIGYAYGINTLKAEEKGIPTVAIDPEQGHLEILQEKIDKQLSHLLTCVLCALLDGIGYPDESFSGILCSEVLHLIEGKDIEESIKEMYKKLIVGGKLVMTALSTNYLKYIDPEREMKLIRDLEDGVKWPGWIKLDDDILQRIQAFTKSENIHSAMKNVCQDYLHFLHDKQMSSELTGCGFIVRDVSLGDHPFNTDAEVSRQFPGQNLQIIAEKF